MDSGHSWCAPERRREREREEGETIYIGPLLLLWFTSAAPLAPAAYAYESSRALDDKVTCTDDGWEYSTVGCLCQGCGDNKTGAPPDAAAAATPPRRMTNESDSLSLERHSLLLWMTLIACIFVKRYFLTSRRAKKWLTENFSLLVMESFPTTSKRRAL